MHELKKNSFVAASMFGLQAMSYAKLAGLHPIYGLCKFKFHMLLNIVDLFSSLLLEGASASLRSNVQRIVVRYILSCCLITFKVDWKLYTSRYKVKYK